MIEIVIGKNADAYSAQKDFDWSDDEFDFYIGMGNDIPVVTANNDIYKIMIFGDPTQLFNGCATPEQAKHILFDILKKELTGLQLLEFIQRITDKYYQLGLKYGKAVIQRQFRELLEV